MARWKEGERPCRVLVIEDNTGDVYLIREALLQADLKVELTTFSDGEEALLYVTAYGNTESASQPDVVLLDLNLPKSSGLEILRAIRGTRFMVAVPVAVMTSSIAPRDKESLLGYDVACCITKPADLDEFLNIGAIVREILGGKAACSGN